MTINPIISIITVSFNAVNTIEQTILSVINQSYPHIEYIIIDGGSTDGTVEIIKKFSNKISYWVSEPDKGIYDAMNKGIQKATGDLIGIINSDDWYENDIINIVAENYSIKNPVIIYGDLVKHNGTKQYNCKPHRPLNQFWMGSVISHPTVFVPRIFYQKYGIFNTTYRVAADYDLLIRLYRNKLNFQYIPYTISHMRSGGVSDTNAILGYKEAFKIANNACYPLYKIIYAFIRKSIAIYIKRFYSYLKK